jgi:hypothetical protein
LKVLADLERDDHKFAFLATRLVGLYRRLWESCVSKHIDGQETGINHRLSPIYIEMPASSKATTSKATIVAKRVRCTAFTCSMRGSLSGCISIAIAYYLIMKRFYH